LCQSIIGGHLGRERRDRRKREKGILRELGETEEMEKDEV
jgi:hypothetical protein